MTISERPTAEHLALLLEQPAPGAIILGSSTLDGPDVLAAGSGYVDVDALCDVTGTISCRRGGQGEGGALRIEVGTLSATLLDVAPDTVRPGQRVQLASRYTWGTDPLFTGRISAINVSEFRDDDGQWHTRTTLSAADAVADLAAITRYGAIVEDGQAAESIPARLTRLIASAPPWLTIEDPAWDLWYLDLGRPQSRRALWWEGLDNGEPARWTAVNGTVDTAPTGARPRFNLDPDGTASRTITGLVPGRMYSVLCQTISTQLAYGVDTPRPVYAGDDGLIFIAQSSTAVLTVSGPATYVHLIGLYLDEWDSPTFAAASTAYESSLASHIHRTCASAPGLRWIVSKAGDVQWLSTNESWPIKATFSDVEPPPGVGGQLHYVDLERGYSTADAVTDVRIESAQRAYDDAGQAVSADRSYGYSDAMSASQWGGTSVTRQTFTASDLDATYIARRAMSGRPELTPTSLRWNAAEDVARLPELEVADKVQVIRSGTTTLHTLAAITHEITASRHMVTLDLIPLEES